MPASAQDVHRAIESLTPAELLKIREYAAWRIKGLGRKSTGRDHEDLMQEAIARTVAGERHWNDANVSFVVHLLGTMRSISNHWADQEPEQASHVELLDTHTGTPEALLAIKQELAAIENLFIDDPAAARVLGCVRAGQSGPEIQRTTGCSKTEFETVMKRIRRRVRTLRVRGESR